jgi:hypothetical protein
MDVYDNEARRLIVRERAELLAKEFRAESLAAKARQTGPVEAPGRAAVVRPLGLPRPRPAGDPGR